MAAGGWRQACRQGRPETVQPIAGPLDSLAADPVDATDDLSEHRIKHGELFGGEPPEHMGDGARAPLGRVVGGGTDADAQAREVLGAEVLNRAAQPVVTAGAAAGAQAQATERQVHVVHQHEQLGGAEAIPVEGGADRAAAVVHVGLRHQQPQALRPGANLGELTVQPGLVAEAHSAGTGEALQHHETHVVTGVGVFGPRIAKTHQQLKIQGRRAG